MCPDLSSVDLFCHALRTVKNFTVHYHSLQFNLQVIVFGGDFRQCATVINKGSKAEIISASLPQSQLWRNMVKLRLTINMRVESSEGDLSTLCCVFPSHV